MSASAKAIQLIIWVHLIDFVEQRTVAIRSQLHRLPGRVAIGLDRTRVNDIQSFEYKKNKMLGRRRRSSASSEAHSGRGGFAWLSLEP